MSKLSDKAISNAKPKDTPYKLFDGQGLSVLVKPNGGKYWRINYRFQGKQKTLALGTYPQITLKDAREKLADARRLLANGTDPAEAKKLQKLHTVERAENTFKALATAWYTAHSPDWKDGHKKRVLRILERDLFPWLGDRPIAEISPHEILKTVERVKDRGALETAHRALRYTSNVFDFAIARLACNSNPATPLKKSPPPAKTQHRAAILEPAEVGALLRAIDGFTGSFVVKCAYAWPRWFSCVQVSYAARNGAK